MKTSFLLSLACLCILVFTSCAPPVTDASTAKPRIAASDVGIPDPPTPWPTFYSTHDPEAEARKNFQNDDVFFYYNLGYSRSYPGFDPRVSREIVGKHDTRYLKGTSDTLRWKGEYEYNQAAIRYGAVYNRTTATLLKIPFSESD